MSLTFPVLVRDEDGVCIAESPALPGWSERGRDIDDLLALARMALEQALEADLEPTGFRVSAPEGSQLHKIAVEEPGSWWWADPSE